MDKSRKWTAGRVIVYILLIIAVITSVFPLIWIFISSFKTNSDFILHPFSLPTRFTLENYIDAWERGNFPTYFVNSLFVAAVSLIIMIGTGAMVAYAITRYKRIRYSNKLMFYFIIGQMISGQVIIISIYLTLNAYHLLDNLLGIALVYAASGLPFVVFMLCGFFKAIPSELYEVARVDGISEWNVFTRIAIPLARPAIATAFITQFLYVWNEFTIAYITTKSPAKFTVPVGIYQAVNKMYSTSYTTACAGLAITALPALLVYALFQKQIVFGISAGAIKG